MSNNSKIEWTDATWNPIVGCSIVSPGCTNCYAMRMAARIEKMTLCSHYDGTTKKVNGNVVWTGKLACAPDFIFTAPLRRKKPTTYFVNSMGDLFHEDCPDEWIDKVFAVMALCPQHTFQVLTKRAKRMRAYCSSDATLGRVLAAANSMMREIRRAGYFETRDNVDGLSGLTLPNVWLGVSCERQQEADERIPLLLQTPAAVRFVSCEPLLGPLDLYHGDPDPRLGGHCATETYIGDWWPAGAPKGVPSTHGLDWVIAGGESGPNARPAHPDWFRSLRDQCDAANVAFFFKQWGELAPSSFMKSARDQVAISVSGAYELRPEIFGPHETIMERVGKKAAGRLLDGVEHNGMPT